MSRYFSTSHRKISAAASKAPARGGPGAEAAGKALGERTAAWTCPSPASGGHFNRATKVPVVKRYAKKAGID